MKVSGKMMKEQQKFIPLKRVLHHERFCEQSALGS